MGSVGVFVVLFGECLEVDDVDRRGESRQAAPQGAACVATEPPREEEGLTFWTFASRPPGGPSSRSFCARTGSSSREPSTSSRLVDANPFREWASQSR